MGARYYSSQLGRFHTADWSAAPVPVPYADLINPQTLNLYAYVKNNPLNLTDPTGHLAAGQIGRIEGAFVEPRMMADGNSYDSVANGTATVITDASLMPNLALQAVMAAAEEERASRQGPRVYPPNFIGPLEPGAVRGPYVVRDLNQPGLSFTKDLFGKASTFFGESDQCVALTKSLSGMGAYVDTTMWREGPAVLGNAIAKGTAISTYDNNGFYPKGDVNKNSGLYWGPGVNGNFYILDQWPGHLPRVRELVRHSSNPSNSADAYHVIYVAPR